MSAPLHENLERLYVEAQKKAHEAYAQQMELGMTAMIQAARQAENTVMEGAK